MGLDVENRRAIDGVQTSNCHREILYLHNLTSCDTETIRSCFCSLGKDPDEWPIFTIARMPRTKVHLDLVDLVEEVHHIDMGEVCQTIKDCRSEPFLIQGDCRNHITPVIVKRFAAR